MNTKRGNSRDAKNSRSDANNGGNTTLIKKKTRIFRIYREIQMGSGAKAYMRKGFLIYEEMHKYFYHMYKEGVIVIYDFAPDPSEFPNI